MNREHGSVVLMCDIFAIFGAPFRRGYSIAQGVSVCSLVLASLSSHYLRPTTRRLDRSALRGPECVKCITSMMKRSRGVKRCLRRDPSGPVFVLSELRAS